MGGITTPEMRKRHYVKRQADGKCVHCNNELPPRSQFKTCAPCRERQRKAARVWREAAKMDPQFDAFAEPDNSGPRCRICLLLEPHICVAGDPHSRSGPGRVYP